MSIQPAQSTAVADNASQIAGQSVKLSVCGSVGLTSPGQ